MLYEELSLKDCWRISTRATSRLKRGDALAGISQRNEFVRGLHELRGGSDEGA